MSSDRIERTGWAIGGIALVATLLFRSLPVSFGFTVGVFVAIFNYRLLVRFVRSVVDAGHPACSRIRLALYLLKYAVTAAVLAAVLYFNLANAIAILAGASVLLPAIGWEMVATQRTLVKEEA